MSKHAVSGILGGAVSFALIASSAAQGQECPIPDRQPATRTLMDLVAADDDLRESLQLSIALGQRVNGDPHTNPVASIADYFEFIDALVTYYPRNINTGLQREGIQISMDRKN